MQYARIASRVFNRPLLIEPRALAPLADYVRSRMTGAPIAADNGVVRSASGYRYLAVDGVALINISGPLVNKGGQIDPDCVEITSYQQIRELIRTAQADPNIQSLLLEFDSPGGEVAGAFDLADEIFAMRGRKPMTAVATDMAASAAYLLASACDELYVTQTAFTGSIGVVLQHWDFSRAIDAAGVAVTYIYAGDHKVDANPWQPLPDAVRADLQSEIDHLYGLFVQRIARYRGLSEAKVIATQARTYLGGKAVEVGLADGVDTAHDLFDRLAVRPADPPRLITATGVSLMSDQDQPLLMAETTDEGFIQAAIANERLRMAQVMGSEAAQGRTDSAVTLLAKTSMDAASIITLLAGMPAAQAAASRLDRAMAAIGTPGIGAEGDPVPLSAAQTILNNHRAATGRH